MPERNMSVLERLMEKVSKLDERDQEAMLLCAMAYAAGKAAAMTGAAAQ